MRFVKDDYGIGSKPALYLIESPRAVLGCLDKRRVRAKDDSLRQSDLVACRVVVDAGEGYVNAQVVKISPRGFEQVIVHR